MPLRLRWPTEFDMVTQKFGVRPEFYKPFGLPGHEGIDFRAPTGSKILACAEGIVSEVRLDGNRDRKKFPYGNQVRIVHSTDEDEFTTIYAHLHEVAVTVGDRVNAGDLLGIADSTGNSDGAHLHLTLKRKGATAAGLTPYPNDIIDPGPFLDPFSGTPDGPGVMKADLGFVSDVTVPDNSVKRPGERFVKTWRVINRGTTSWGDGYTLAFFADEHMDAPEAVPLPPAQPGEMVNVSVSLTAPDALGFRRSTWKARDPDGELFGDILFALIQVPDAEDDLPLNAVIDLSHHNRVTSLQAVRDDGIAAIIHKATQGLQFVDRCYHERREQALGIGFLWGAYHFGEGGDPVGQASHFLDTVQPDRSTLLVLDFERNPLGRSMNLLEAEQFVERIRDEVGRWPLVYTGRWYIREFIGDHHQTSLANCQLWVAYYADAPVIPSQWSTWTLWQYSNGVDGPEPHRVQGIERCDRNMFNGTLDALQQFWGAQP